MAELFYSPSWSEFVSTAARKIRSFQDLSEGWHYGGGRALGSDIVDTAIKIDEHLRLLGFSNTNAFPGAEGEIMIVGYRGVHDLEVTVHRPDSIDVVHLDSNVEKTFKATQNLQSAKIALSIMGKTIWGSFDLSMDNTMTLSGNDFAALASGSHTMAEYQSSAGTVSSALGDQFASTSGSFMIREWRVSPQSSGASQPRPIRRRAA